MLMEADSQAQRTDTQPPQEGVGPQAEAAKAFSTSSIRDLGASVGA